MTGLHYPDNLYADHEEAKARRVANQAPTGAYRSTDPVTKPAHYQRAGIETIDYIRATLDGPGFEAYCIGNVLKYVSRYREKGGIEDLRKAQVYLGWAINPKTDAFEPAAMREAKVAYDTSWDRARGPITLEELKAANPGCFGGIVPQRTPKWDSAWISTPPNCDGLKARDIRAPHPMQAEALRQADEFGRDDNASGV